MKHRAGEDTPLVDLSRAPAAAAFPKPVIKAIEAIVGINQINAIFRKVDSHDRLSFVNSTLAELSLSLAIEGEERLAALEGPIILFGNHPLGLADQFLLASIINRNFSSFRILANMYMNFGASFDANIIPVDPFRTDAAANAAAMRGMIDAFGRDYQVLGIFPAGICSRYQPKRKLVSDPPWSEAFWKLAQMKHAKLVPIFFDGQNSRFFHTAARLAPTLAPALLPREFLRVRGKSLRAVIGEPVTIEDVTQSTPREGRRAFLRSLVYELGTSNGADVFRVVAHQAQATAGQPRQRAAVPLTSTCETDCRVEIFEGLGTSRVLQAGLALRHRRFCDLPAAEDQFFYHLVLVDRHSGIATGYLRVLDWRAQGQRLGAVSPTLQSYRLGASAPFAQGLLEIGRFCTDPDRRTPIGPLLLWKSLAKLADDLGRRTGAIGVVTLLGLHPSMAAAQFAMLQATAPMVGLSEVIPVAPLLQASRHHDWSPSPSHSVGGDSSSRIDSLLKVYRSAGARFGPACRMSALGGSPGILTMLRMEDLNARLRWDRKRPPGTGSGAPR